jgi:hypothetical protein
MRTRHVWLLSPLDVGAPLQGFVLAWRKRARLASPPTWEAQLVYVDRSEVTRIEWVPATYLRPVSSERPD